MRSLFVDNFARQFLTQSQNSSAKLALVVDGLLQNHIEKDRNWKNDWNKLDDTFFTSHESFLFHTSAFYFRMFNKIISRLMDTGVMKYLCDEFYTKTPSFDPKHQNEPKVLNLDDMAVGFNIWLGSCCFAFIAFLGERILGTKNKNSIQVDDVRVQLEHDSTCDLEDVISEVVNVEPSMVSFEMEVAAEIHNTNSNDLDESSDEEEVEALEQTRESKAHHVFQNWQNFDDIEEIVDEDDLLD
jgi:hypothetical protein